MNNLKTAAFRKQHEGIIEIVNSILASLDPVKLSINSHGIRKLLTKLSQNLKIHLILEDTALYPVLANSEDNKVRAISLKYMEEMGVISGSYTSYTDKWSAGSSIKDGPETFINETKDLLGALLNRISMENKEFYKIIDEL